MRLAAIAIEKSVVTYFVVFLLVVGGLSSFFSLGQLEDPEFTIKAAVVMTAYPGASPEEVELEVTDRIELAVQELKELKFVESFSRAGFSLVKLAIKPEYTSDRIPQIWDKLRAKIRDAEASLPPGALRPVINDDFGDVFGLLLGVTGDGYSYAELKKYVDGLKKELSLVEGVGRVDTWGVQDRVIYLDVSQTQLSLLGLSDESIIGTLRQQNAVVDAGSVDVLDRRFRIAPTGAFTSPRDIAELTIRPSLIDSIQQRQIDPEDGASSELIRIADIGDVRSGYQDPPNTMMRYNGQPALALAIANRPGVNLVDMGAAVDVRLATLIRELPIGIEISRIHWQSDDVKKAVDSFFISLLEALLIVLGVLALAMGWRMGVIIGTGLVLTILGTFIVMALFGIDLERMSLGALVVALGMMVDNSIVVADGIAVRLQKGMNRVEAAVEAASKPAWPLLGATVVAVMAFYPIYASNEGAGEYCASLFTVVGISLMISWVLSMTVTPLQCVQMLRVPGGGGDDADPYGGRVYGIFREFLRGAIRVRILSVAIMVGLLVVAGIGFGGVNKLFFPDSAMTKFMIDYWNPEGTRIQQTSGDIRALEVKLMNDPRVKSVSSFIGAGPPRFYLPVEPESPYPSYAHLVVNLHDVDEMSGLIAELDPWLAETYPQALAPIRRFGVGPSNTWKAEIRISGPAVADPNVLRSLAADYRAMFEASPLTAYTRIDWRQRVLKVVPRYNQERARWAGVTREDIATTTKRAYDGRTVGLYREQDDLIPIVLRHVEEERDDVEGLGLLQVKPVLSTHTIPMAQIVDGVASEWEDPLIWRRDRRRTIKVQANPILGVTLPTLLEEVSGDIEAIELPPGYTMEWGGETESSRDAQKSLIPGIIPAVAIMALVIVALFNSIRVPVIIFLVIPLAMIGVVAGLLFTGTAFGFVALLGAMSLAGMMIKNSIVLIDEINENLAAGGAPYESVIEAAVSRLRPVVLAAATTVLGVAPLMQDVFWIGLAITIMAGLSFGTVLTMVIVPVLYTMFYRIRTPLPA